LYHPFETPFIDDPPRLAALRYQTWLQSQLAFLDWVREQLAGRELVFTTATTGGPDGGPDAAASYAAAATTTFTGGGVMTDITVIAPTAADTASAVERDQAHARMLRAIVDAPRALETLRAAYVQSTHAEASSQAVCDGNCSAGGDRPLARI
jgi:hypothetical protein